MIPQPLVSVQWLQDHLQDEHLVILDASMKKVGSNEPQAADRLCIPGARPINIKGVFSDPASPFPNTLLSPEAFSKAAQELGINQNSQIVVYDKLGVYSSPRVWWMFRCMGHQSVAVLDGGLPAWIKAGYATADIKPYVGPVGNFQANFDPNRVWASADVQANLTDARAKVLDARSLGRFDGTAPEPRPDLRSGHIPQSHSFPYTEVLRDGHFLPREELEAIFARLNIGDESLVFSCGSGLTACITLLACELVRENHTAIFDGSWTEWAQPDSGFPVET
ncbi:MAG: rhodanese-like domain-containing protein [Bacteroidota bacterium]